LLEAAGIADKHGLKWQDVCAPENNGTVCNSPCGWCEGLAVNIGDIIRAAAEVSP
jgi:hypothetical protein